MFDAAILADDATVAADTGCYRNGDGYNRVVLYRDWDPADPRRLAKVEIRVDRIPALSYAMAYVWVSATGWQFIVATGPEEWWEQMPGYTRGQTTSAARNTLNLADTLLEILIEVGI